MLSPEGNGMAFVWKGEDFSESEEDSDSFVKQVIN